MGAQGAPAGVRSWNKAMGRGSEFGGRDLCNSLKIDALGEGAAAGVQLQSLG